jgi:hypothetical protein
MGEKGEKALLCFFLCEKSRDYPGIHWCCSPVPPVFRSLPKLIQYGMKADAPGKLLMRTEERADQEGVTGFVICDGRAGAGPGY